MELVDLTKILKPGDEVYSVVYGCETKIIEINSASTYPILCVLGNYSKFGQYFSSHSNAESVIFPSKTQRDWAKYVKEKETDGLLEEAKLRYPIGTKFKCLYRGFNKVSLGTYSEYSVNTSNEIWIQTEGNYPNGKIYENGKWAEIIEPLFTTEDGMDIYDGDKYWYVGNTSGGIFHEIANANRGGKVHPYFSSEQAAQDWIYKNNPKSSVFSSEQVEEIIRLIKENK